MAPPALPPDCSLMDSLTPDPVTSDVESLLSGNEGSTRPSTRQVTLNRPVTIHDFGDSDIEIRVNDTTFKTQRRLIKKFAVLCSLIDAESQKGPVAIVIDSDKCTADDFYGALVVLHASAIQGPYHFDVPTLISALNLATTYDYPDLRNFAISSLDESRLGLTDRVWLARKYSISDWEAAVLEELCERDEPIAAEEANAIGLEALVRVAHIREERILNVQGRRVEGQHRPETEGWFKTMVLNELEEIRDKISSQETSLRDLGSENLQVTHELFDFVMKHSGYETS